jgi:hypothetical protein
VCPRGQQIDSQLRHRLISARTERDILHTDDLDVRATGAYERSQLRIVIVGPVMLRATDAVAIHRRPFKLNVAVGFDAKHRSGFSQRACHEQHETAHEPAEQLKYKGIHESKINTILASAQVCKAGEGFAVLFRDSVPQWERPRADVGSSEWSLGRRLMPGSNSAYPRQPERRKMAVWFSGHSFPCGFSLRASSLRRSVAARRFS